MLDVVDVVIPYLVEILFGLMIISVFCGLLAIPKLEKMPPVRWIDHPQPSLRYMHRAILFGAMILLPLSANWVVTVSVLSHLGVPTAKHNGYAWLIQIWLLFGSLGGASWLYLRLVAFIRR